MPEAQSLYKRYPKHFEVPLVLLAAAGLLIAGLLLPTFKLKKLIFGSDEYSIWGGVMALWEGEHYVLAVVIFFFSMIFPVFKLGGLAWLWYIPADPEQRRRFLHWLGVLGKWSMLDVFVVAVLIVLVKASAFADARAMIGIYLFGAAIVASLIASIHIERLAGKARGT